ncbi:hypothetical protein [Halosimplex pelagicum]|nr:hypothetical protein [Halosimplex pelagicum]
MTVATAIAGLAVVGGLAALSIGAARWRDRQHARAQLDRLGRDT